MVGLFKVADSAADMAELRGYIEAHAEKTGSFRAKELLADWETSASKFVKVRRAGAPARGSLRSSRALSPCARLTAPRGHARASPSVAAPRRRSSRTTMRA